MSDGFVQGSPRLLLRIEGASLLLCALVAYGWSGQSWWMAAALIFVPDASMLGYLAGPKIGAASYNVAHTLVGPLLVLAASLFYENSLAAGLALTWVAHIGLDRALGYGLKYTSGFGDTHLGPLGRAVEKTGVRFCRA